MQLHNHILKGKRRHNIPRVVNRWLVIVRMRGIIAQAGPLYRNQVNEERRSL